MTNDQYDELQIIIAIENYKKLLGLLSEEEKIQLDKHKQQLKNYELNNKKKE